MTLNDLWIPIVHIRIKLEVAVFGSENKNPHTKVGGLQGIARSSHHPANFHSRLQICSKMLSLPVEVSTARHLRGLRGFPSFGHVSFVVGHFPFFMCNCSCLTFRCLCGWAFFNSLVLQILSATHEYIPRHTADLPAGHQHLWCGFQFLTPEIFVTRRRQKIPNLQYLQRELDAFALSQPYETTFLIFWNLSVLELSVTLR